MANNTVKFDIKAAVDTRGLDEFKSQLGELRSAAEPLDRVLGDAVKSIKEWAEGSRLSERNTAAATSAIDALTRAMTAGGNEWKKGTQTANDLNRTLRETVSAANAAKAALAAPARTTIGANQQISDLRKGLQELTIGSSQYLAMLQQITEREALLGRRTGRAGVVAANQAYEGALLTRGYGAADRLQAMPDTTAALRQRLSELSQEFPNVIRGSERYVKIATEMRVIESQLAKDLTGTTNALRQRSAATQAKIDAVRAYNEQAIRERVQAGEASIAERRRTAFGDVPQAMRSESGVFIAPPFRSSGYSGMGTMYSSPIGPELSPQSTAALGGRLRDLSVSLEMVARGSERYLEISREMRQIERDLARDLSRSADETNALANARKRLADASSLNRSSNASGFAAWSSSVNDRLDIQNAIDRYRQQQGLPVGFRSGAAQFVSGQNNAPLGPAAPTELLRSIDGISTAGASAGMQSLGRSYKEVAQQIRETAQAAGGSTRALQAERAAWEQLQASVKPATREYRQAQREMERLDRQMGTRRPGEAFLESAGAISAGAFFGGPEGLIGGLLGMAVGGPGAALGGASIGAQLGIVRKSIGDTAVYSAELEKLRIALKGVVGGNAEYAKSLTIVDQASTSLNLNQRESLQGFTRLAAAVSGAGGSVADAEIVFRGITNAIKATGGSSQDVQSAILAMSQVFSKGKVSAEELQGQLGERLPGAVTLFAQATGRTLPQLSKDLEQGTVGLNDLMKFTQALSERYSSTAQSIAGSSADAGAKLATTLGKLREEFGKNFADIGASVQNATNRLAEFALEVYKTWNLQKQLGGVLQPNQRARIDDEARRLANLRQPRDPFRNNEEFQSIRAQLERNAMLQIGYDTGVIQPPGPSRSVSPTDFADPKSGKGDEKARRDAEREKRKQEEAAASQQRLDQQLYNDRVRLDEQIAENKIRLEDRVFQYKQELMRRERERQLQLDQLRQQTFIAGLSPEGRSAIGPLQELLQRIQGFGQERQALSDAVEAAKQAVKSAKEMAANRERFGAMYMEDGGGVASGGTVVVGSSGIVARTGNTGQSTGPHLDGRWADRRPITVADLDRYIRVNGRAPSSFGVTSGYGPRSLFGRSFHAGVDVGTPSGSAISLINGAKMLRDLGNTGAGGYAIEIMTAQGPMRLLHLQAGSAARGGAAPTTTTLANNRTIRTPGASSAALRAAGAAGDVMIADAELTQAQAMYDAYNKSQGALTSESAKLAITQLIQPLRDQGQALRDNYQELQTRTRLEMEGVKPELIEFEARKLQILRQQERVVNTLGEFVREYGEAFEKALGKDKFAALMRDLYDEQERLTTDLVALEERKAKALADPALAYQRRINELNKSLRDFNDTQQLVMDMSGQFSSGLANGFSNAASAIITGNGSIQQSFADLFNNVAKMFIDTISRVLADQATQWIMQLLRPPAPAANTGGVAGLFSSALPMLGPAVDFAGGGVAGLFSSALPMLGPAAGITGSFATGGISSGPTSGYPVTLHGTEAIVPLPNGRAIPVEMSGSGGTSVVVNVNMGTGEASVSSSERDGELLGKALSEAVQAELIRQKRPGGILYR